MVNHYPPEFQPTIQMTTIINTNQQWLITSHISWRFCWLTALWPIVGMISSWLLPMLGHYLAYCLWLLPMVVAYGYRLWLSPMVGHSHGWSCWQPTSCQVAAHSRSNLSVARRAAVTRDDFHGTSLVWRWWCRQVVLQSKSCHQFSGFWWILGGSPVSKALDNSKGHMIWHPHYISTTTSRCHNCCM